MRARLEKLVGDLRWGGRVLRGYARIGWVRKSQFRWEFLSQVLMDGFFYLSFILTFKILYGLDAGATLAGWSYAETKVFLGMAFIADAVMMTWLGQSWHFGGDLKNGNLDSFRVRPGPTAFLYFFQRFSPEGLTNFVIACAWMSYALMGVIPDVVPGIHVAWALPCAFLTIAWAQVFLMISYSLVELWVLNSDLGHLVSMFLSNLSERPLEIYPRLMMRMMIFVMPVAGVAWYPASLVLGRLDPAFAALYPLVLIAFAWLVMRGFRRGLRRYESAMG